MATRFKDNEDALDIKFEYLKNLNDQNKTSTDDHLLMGYKAI